MLSSLYPWLKALHIVSVISWMAGLLYLPRLFVNHAESAPPGSELSSVFAGMERRLLKRIMNPAMIATWGIRTGAFRVGGIGCRPFSVDVGQDRHGHLLDLVPSLAGAKTP